MADSGTPLPEAMTTLAAALRDPGTLEQEIERLSGELQPYGRFDPRAFRVLDSMEESPGTPLFGGLADVPKIAMSIGRDQPRGAKQGSLDMFWIGTARGLVITLPVSGVAFYWPWAAMTGMKAGRRVGKFGSARIAFRSGDDIKVRVPSSQVDLILALFDRYGE